MICVVHSYSAHIGSIDHQVDLVQQCCMVSSLGERATETEHFINAQVQSQVPDNWHSAVPNAYYSTLHCYY